MEVESVCATRQQGEGAEDDDVMFERLFFCHCGVIGGWGLLAVGAQDGGGGFEHEDEVEGQGPVVDILHVHFHPVFESYGVAVWGDLPNTGDAWFHGEASHLPAFVLCDFGWQGWAWADDAHVAEEDVEELRELVDASFAEEAAHAGDARVVGHLKYGASHLVLVHKFLFELLGVDDHGAELVDLEDTAAQAGAFLLEEHGAFAVELDAEGDDEEEGQSDEYDAGGEDDVDEAFDEEADVVGGHVGYGQDGVGVEVADVGRAGHTVEECGVEAEGYAVVLADVEESDDVGGVDVVAGVYEFVDFLG